LAQSTCSPFDVPFVTWHKNGMCSARELTRGGAVSLGLALSLACVPNERLDDYSRGGTPGAGGSSAEAGAGGSEGSTSDGGAGGTTSPVSPSNGGAGGSGGMGGNGLSQGGTDSTGGSSSGADAAVEAGSGEPAPTCNGGSLGPDGDTCYFMALTALSWPDARQSCLDAGRSLVKLDSTAEDAFVGGLSQANLWIGASDTLVDGSFVWSDNSPIVFGNWGPAQPDAYPGPDCVEKRQEAGEPWYDQPCVDAKLYICEAPAE
jgi:Lectin C-type domain